MVERFANGCALVIGIANYAHVGHLPGEVLNDANDIAALLKNDEYCGYSDDRVTQLIDKQATAEGIRLGLRQFAAATRPDDTAVFFFSGHGGRVENGPDQGTYLIPYDCDPQNLKATAIPSDELSALFANIKARCLVILLDACHSAGAGNVKLLTLAEKSSGLIKAGLDKAAYDVLATGAGRVMMASCRPQEVSYVLPGMRHSLFTHYLIEALEGAAGKAGEEVIRVFDVFQYVADRVPGHKPDQQPVFKAQDVEKNFPLALFRDHKGSTEALPAAQAESRRMRLDGRAQAQFCRRLGNRWHMLARYLEIPPYDRALFAPGLEAGAILDWLEQRQRLDVLRDAIAYLSPDLDDLREVLCPR